jgi:hypothetical protein
MPRHSNITFGVHYREFDDLCVFYQNPYRPPLQGAVLHQLPRGGNYLALLSVAPGPREWTGSRMAAGTSRAMRSVMIIVRRISSFVPPERKRRMGRTDDGNATYCTSISSRRYALRLQFLGIQSPQDPQLGAWKADLPARCIWPEEVGTVSAWALDFSRGNFYYRLEGDHELSAHSAVSQRI